MNTLTKMTAATILATGAASAGTLGSFTSDVNGFDTHTYYYDDGQEVTVFDTQFVPALTQAMLDKIASETDSPVTRLVITHPNPDKFNGIALLHAIGATSIASASTAEAMIEADAYKRYYWVEIAGAFTNETYPKIEEVQQTFDGELVIELATGETITLFELENGGVSTTQTVARIDATGDLIVGDLVHHDAHAWLEGGILNGAPAPDLEAWKAALRELPALGTTVYGGRGTAGVPVADAVEGQIAYLDGMSTLVDAYIAELGPRKDELLGENAAEHYAELQRRAAEAFPDRSLDYLIGYGIYGLVNSRL